MDEHRLPGRQRIFAAAGAWMGTRKDITNLWRAVERHERAIDKTNGRIDDLLSSTQFSLSRISDYPLPSRNS